MGIPSERMGRTFIALLVFTGMVMGMAVHSLHAGIKKKDRVEIKHKSRDLKKVTEELTKKKREKEKLRREAKKIVEKVKENEAKIHDVEKSLIFTNKRKREIKQNLAETQFEKDRVEAGLEETETGLRDAIKVCYVSSQLMGPRAFLPVYSSQVIPIRNQEFRRLQGLNKETGHQLKELNSTYDVFHQEAEKQRKTISSLQSGLSSEEKKLKKVKTRQEVIQAEFQELKKTAEELAALIDLLRSKAKKEKELEEKARLEKLTSGQSPIFAHSLVWPAHGKIRTQFGRQKHPDLGTPYHSNGLLLNLNEYQPVIAVSDGNVLFSGEFMSYGLMVVVEHPGDWDTVYGNLSRIAVERGQEVKKGDVMGWTGITEKGVHETYFELRFYGEPTNPIPWLEKR